MASPPSAPPSVLLRLRPPCAPPAAAEPSCSGRICTHIPRQEPVAVPWQRRRRSSSRRGYRGLAGAASNSRAAAPTIPGTSRPRLRPIRSRAWMNGLRPALRRWDVPWEWPTVSLTMVACAISFLLTGMVEQSVLEYLGFQAEETTIDEKTEVLFFRQFSVTAVVIGVIFGITNTFRPFSDDIFRYDFKEPFKLQNGWLLWAGISLFGAIISIALAGAAMTFLNGEAPERETDSLILLLPLIGSSSISTACLLGITGVLAPILEETVFRGFLMVSLTMC